MSQYFTVHPTHPQPRLINQATGIVRAGGVIAYPTDSCYAIGCQIGNKEAMQRLRNIRKIDDKHHLTLMCRDLSEIARSAMVSDKNFAFLKIPGSYTFILPARREVPRRVTRRKTIGVRIPGHPAAYALLAELGEPMLSTTLTLPGDAAPLSDAQQIRSRLERRLDLIIDAGPCDTQPSTVLDLTGGEPQVLRKGKGPLAPFAVEPV